MNIFSQIILLFCVVLVNGCNWMDSNYWEMEQQTENSRLVVESLDLGASNFLPEIKAKYFGKKAFSAYMRSNDAATMGAPDSHEFVDLLNRELALRDICPHGYVDLHIQYDRVFNRYWGICNGVN